MRQVMWQKGGIASTHMTEMHAYGYSLKDTTRYAAGVTLGIKWPHERHKLAAQEIV